MHYLGETDQRNYDLEWWRFKLAAIAAHPELTQAVLALDFNTETAAAPAASGPREQGEWAPRLSDEEIEAYQPLAAQEVDETMQIFEGFGLGPDGP